jgi:hypothetical protein
MSAHLRHYRGVEKYRSIPGHKILTQKIFAARRLGGE